MGIEGLTASPAAAKEMSKDAAALSQLGATVALKEQEMEMFRLEALED